MRLKILSSVVANSYNICLISGIIGMILSGYGANKCKKVGIIAIGVYLIIMVLATCLMEP